MRIESAGSPVISQKRLGKNGKEFKMYKIRSMFIDAERDSGAKWAEKDDPRITKMGRFIRRTKIDELPQLLNVFSGDMSLVGPRPERKYFYELFRKDIPDFHKRLDVKPGITGLAQVEGGYDLSPQEKLEFDMRYIEHRSVKLDTIIIIKTFWVVVTGKGSR